ncbi:MAG: PQQ-binding-like beta-propeller repeat protein [Candidatus Bathyarchaeota archaeon]|nr:PQQ-binding-like beta-propeller repeat protein [Candidatus Bathyarchaeota archaeon]
MSHCNLVSSFSFQNLDEVSKVKYSWPCFHYDLANTGYSDSPAPRKGSLLWNLTIGDVPEGGPAVYDGVIYVATAAGSDSSVYAIDLITGKILWRRVTGTTMRGAPAVAEGKVFAGCEDGRLYCLDAATGRILWTFSTYDKISRAHPKFVNGMVIVASCDHTIYALNASEVEMAEEKRIIWAFNTGGQVRGTPAIVGGKVYMGSSSKKVYCLDLLTGTEIWRFQSPTDPKDFRGSPTVAYGKVYIGSDDQYVYALDMNTGEQKWRFKTGGMVRSTPAAAYGKIYILSADGYVYCLNAETGEQVWRFNTGGSIAGDFSYSSASVADGLVFIGSSNDVLYCLNATTGDVVWSYQTGGDIRGAPAIVGGLLIVGSMDDNLYVFGELYTGPKASFTFSPTNPLAGEAVTFNASASQPNVVKYTWNFGDGNVTTVSVPTIIHIFAAEGQYNVTLTVEDYRGGTDRISAQVTVSPKKSSFDPYLIAGIGVVAVIAVTVIFAVVRRKK